MPGNGRGVLFLQLGLQNKTIGCLDYGLSIWMARAGASELTLLLLQAQEHKTSNSM